MTKIIWGINIPYQSQQLDFEASDIKRKEIEATGEFASFLNYSIFIPCIRTHKEMYFELCECCGSQVVGGRAKRGWKSCSKECHNKVGSAWAHHKLQEEQNLKGKRPIFFWFKIRDECFRRDNFLCRKCGKDIRTDIKPGESHHIIPISKGGSNKLENLITYCYNCHKLEHSAIEKIKNKHKILSCFSL